MEFSSPVSSSSSSSSVTVSPAKQVGHLICLTRGYLLTVPPPSEKNTSKKEKSTEN